MNTLETTYKGIHAYLLQDGELTVILSNYGAKLQSIRFRGKEYLVQNTGSDRYRISQLGDSFMQGEFSGFDDMFPNISAGLYVGGAFDGTSLPDHGEVWSATWDGEITDTGVRLSVLGVVLPYRLEKQVQVSGSIIILSYTLTNLSEHAFEFIWAAHPLFVLEEGTHLDLPNVTQIVNVFGGQRYLGSDGQRHGWPISDDLRDLRELSPSNRCQNKYYVENEREESRSRICYPDGTIVSILGINAPYHGVWVDEGVQMNCIAPEPCTGAYDTQARAHNSGRISRIEPHATTHFGVILSFEGE